MRDQTQKDELKQLASQLFNSRTPISNAELFAGRQAQIMKTVSAIRQQGSHAIIYGERGVGKTSLANVASLLVAMDDQATPTVIARINCDGTDQFSQLWRKVFSKIQYTEEVNSIGLVPEKRQRLLSVLDKIGDATITPGLVEQTLAKFGRYCHMIVVLDEFDRLPEEESPKLVADTIKSLADNANPATVIVVGVGDSVAGLVRGHESVRRHLIEVPLPRMSKSEMEKVVNDRVPKLQLTIDDGALKLVSLLSRGLPYYVHLLGKHAACAAIDADADVITAKHVHVAMNAAIEDSEREMRRVYYEATKSRQPGSFFDKSLAACALTPKDEFGYFTAADVRAPMSAIMGRSYSIPHFVRHLERFCDKAKGGILQPAGPKHSRSYRFADPLMEPFVVIKSLAAGVIAVENLKADPPADGL